MLASHSLSYPLLAMSNPPTIPLLPAVFPQKGRKPIYIYICNDFAMYFCVSELHTKISPTRGKPNRMHRRSNLHKSQPEKNKHCLMLCGEAPGTLAYWSLSWLNFCVGTKFEQDYPASDAPSPMWFQCHWSQLPTKSRQWSGKAWPAGDGKGHCAQPARPGGLKQLNAKAAASTTIILMICAKISTTSDWRRSCQGLRENCC